MLPSPLPAASAYAARLGWPVFPVGADCRRPLVRRGCHAASTDPCLLEEMFSRPANIALATGLRAGVFVLDVDVKGADGEASLVELQTLHAPLPATWESSTPSGGRHIYFRQPERPLPNRVGFAPGLDVRADGGSVALPPSRRADGAYRWTRPPRGEPAALAPAWLLALIDPPPRPRPPAPRLRLDGCERTARYVCAAIDGECADLAAMKPSTGRNHRLFVAAARLGELVGAGWLGRDVAEDALERAAHDCGLAQDDGRRAVAATIRSGLVRGMARPRAVLP